jgi:tRNA(Ile)-lysidine synthetase-like protein
MTIYLKTAQRRSLQKLLIYLDNFLLPCMQNGFIIAVSGGPDSRALLESIALWPHRDKSKFVVASFDHAVRLESAQESYLVLARAKRLGFDTFYAQRSSQTYAGEQELRNWRYEELKKISQKSGCKSVVLAHHADDNAEGFLMALIGSGGGSFGAAINNYTDNQNLNLIRPFLDLSKKELLLFLTLYKKTDFFIDNSDEAQHGQRAKVRQAMLPLLEEFYPNIKERLNLFAKNQSMQKDLLESLSKPLIYFDNQQAFIDCSAHSLLISCALKTALSKLFPKKDFRSSKNTLEKLVLRVQEYNSLIQSALDPSIKCSKVKQMENKKYIFSGISAQIIQNKLVLSIICSYP